MKTPNGPPLIFGFTDRWLLTGVVTDALSAANMYKSVLNPKSSNDGRYAYTKVVIAHDVTSTRDVEYPLTSFIVAIRPYGPKLLRVFADGIRMSSGNKDAYPNVPGIRVYTTLENGVLFDVVSFVDVPETITKIPTTGDVNANTVCHGGLRFPPIGLN